MKEYDIARAMTEVSDDLLLEAEHARVCRRTVKLHRLIAVAAVIAMLAVTVGAANMGVTWNVEKESGEELVEKYGGLAWDYYKDHGSCMEFEKLEFSIPLQRVEVSENAVSRLRNVLDRYWHLTRLDDYAMSHEWKEDEEFVFDAWCVDSYMQHFVTVFGVSQSVEPCYGTLEDVEALLGITLAVPDTLREAVRAEAKKYGDAGLQVRIFSGKTYAEVTELKGWVDATKVIVSWQLSDYCTNGSISCSVTVPLTEEAAQQGVQGVYHSYKREGAIWQEEQNIGGRELVFFGNDPEEGYDGWTQAVYTEGGIGYCISARRDADIPYYSPSWPFYDSAKDMVLSVLTDGE